MTKQRNHNTQLDASDIATRRMLWLGIATFVALIVWASIGELHIFSVATGQVVPATRVKQIQHLEGGIISEILVEEGQSVTKNQPLVILEPTRSQAEVDELALRIAALNTDIFRLDAEASLDDQIEFDTGFFEQHPDLAKQANELFRARKENLLADISVQSKLIAQRQQNLIEVNARFEKTESVLGFLQEQVQISKDLLAQNLSNRMKHLVLLRQAADLEGDIAIFRASQGRVRATIDEAKARLVSIRARFVESARTERDRISRSLAELSERLVRFQDSLSRTVLRAPVDGIIKTIHVATQGGVVKAASTVLEIVPSADKLVVEAQLPIQDIGFVKIGSVARLQLASADAQVFDELIGKVTHISADALVTDRGIAFYKIRIETEQAWFTNGEQRYNLYPGMQIQSSIQTGSRTIMDYILSPILRSTSEALHER